jgi:hypothetical protein
MTLGLGDNYLPIAADDLQNIGDKTVTVTFEGTQDFGGYGESREYYTYLWPNGVDPRVSMPNNHIYYQLFDADNVRLSKNNDFYWDDTLTAGLIFAEFKAALTENKNIRIFVPESQTLDNSSLQSGIPYTGYIIFGIKLV